MRAFISTIINDVLDVVRAAFPALVKSTKWGLKEIANAKPAEYATRTPEVDLPPCWHEFVRCLYALQKISNKNAHSHFLNCHLSTAAFRDIVECWLSSMKSPPVISTTSFIYCTETFLGCSFNEAALKAFRGDVLAKLTRRSTRRCCGRRRLKGQPVVKNFSGTFLVESVSKCNERIPLWTSLERSREEPLKYHSM